MDREPPENPQQPDEPATAAARELFRPLTAIVSNAQAARRLLEADEPNHDEIRQALVDIASEGQRAAGILRRLESLLRESAKDE